MPISLITTTLGFIRVPNISFFPPVLEACPVCAKDFFAKMMLNSKWGYFRDWKWICEYISYNSGRKVSEILALFSLEITWREQHNDTSLRDWCYLEVKPQHKSTGLHLKQWGCLHPHRKLQCDNTHIAYHICMHTLQSLLLSFDTDNTTACHQSLVQQHILRKCSDIFHHNGIRQTMTVTSHCVSLCYESLVRDELYQQTNQCKAEGNVLLQHSKQSSNCNHYYKEKLWWIEKKKTCCSCDVANHSLHLLTICNSEVMENIAAFLIVTTHAVCSSIIFEIQFQL